MRIEYLLIRNFKSIRELEINDIEDVLILVGRNNAGKSVVLDAKSAIYLLGGKLNKIEQFGYSDNHRSFVIIDKVMNTSNKYPRKAGLPSKKPL